MPSYAGKTRIANSDDGDIIMDSAASVPFENLQIPQRIERLPLTSYQRFLGFIIITAWFFDDVRSGVLTFLLPVLGKEFHLSPVMMGTLLSMSFCGMFIGTGLSGLLSDKLGRKIILQWSMILWGVAGILCAISWDITSLFVFRFLLGVGLELNSLSLPLLCRSFSPRTRGDDTWPSWKDYFQWESL